MCVGNRQASEPGREASETDDHPTVGYTFPSHTGRTYRDGLVDNSLEQDIFLF